MMRHGLLLALVAALGLLAFTWPLFVVPQASVNQASQAPLLFAVVLPLVLAMVAAELSSHGISPRALAMLGVLSALGVIARPLGAGLAGIELSFILIIMGGRAFGAGFGFLLGNTTLLTSALVTGGIGPWLPYQMLAAGYVGLGAGLLPKTHRRRWEIVTLAGYGTLAAFIFGWLMDLAFWPYAVGTGTDASYVPGAPLLENLHRFVVFNVLTSMGWNIGRALTTCLGLILLGSPILRVLRRTTRRARFLADTPATP